MKYKAVVIVGPTASGKSGAAIELARRVGGEVVSADSRAIYRGLDVGTAKPTRAEMGDVPHWGIDLVEPDERFTAYDYKKYALSKIQQIIERGRVPIVAGGTGLYVDAVVYDYQFNGVVKNTCADRSQVDKSFLQLGIKVDRAVLRERIRARAEVMFGPEIEVETRRLAERYAWDLQAMRSNIYPIVHKMMQGELTREEAIEESVRDDMSLVKRQMTWFKRNSEIRWLPLEEVVDYAVGELAK
jgi:tRNA dimethylallyltransferase